MKTKCIMTLRLPPVLKQKIERIASTQGISENQLALYMLTKEVTELEASSYITNYNHGKTKKEIDANFDAAMKVLDEKNSNKEIPEWDRL